MLPVVILVLLVIVLITWNSNRKKRSTSANSRISSVDKDRTVDHIVDILNIYANYEEACFKVHDSIIIHLYMLLYHEDDELFLEFHVFTFDVWDDPFSWRAPDLYEAKDTFTGFFKRVPPSDAGEANYKYVLPFYRLPKAQSAKIVCNAVKRFNKERPSCTIKAESDISFRRSLNTM